MPFEPKHKTGETMEVDSNNPHEVVIITSYETMRKYCNGSIGTSAYDERDEKHVLYAVYDKQLGMMDWYNSIQMNSYCKNTNRGKKYLLEKFDNLCSICKPKCAEEFKKLFTITD